jgi:hypothetical protein
MLICDIWWDVITSLSNHSLFIVFVTPCTNACRYQPDCSSTPPPQYRWCLPPVDWLHTPKDYNIKMLVTYASQSGDMQIVESTQSVCWLYLPSNSPTIMQCHPSGPSEGVSNAVLYGHIWNRRVIVIPVPAVHGEESLTEFRAKFFIYERRGQLTK